MAADRQRLIRVIHVARRELAMEDDTYRDILQRVGNARSTKDLSVSNLQRVLDHLKACGFKVRPNGRKPARTMASYPVDRKIRALWLFAHDLGIVRDPSERALAAYVKRLAGVDALQWTNGDQVLALIESLKAWIMRYLPNRVRDLAPIVWALPLNDIERGDLQARLNEAFARGTYDPMLDAWERLRDLQRKHQGNGGHHE